MLKLTYKKQKAIDAQALSAWGIYSQLRRDSRFFATDKHQIESAEGEETEASSGDDTDHLFSPNVTAAVSYSEVHMHRFFTAKTHRKESFFVSQLKPTLTEEEKELLKEFLKVLCLDVDEFKLKLQELKVSVKSFLQTLKDNLLMLGLPSPKYTHIFLQEFLKRNLLPEILLEKIEAKKLLDRVEAQAIDSFRPRPSFSLRPKPPGFK